MSMHFQRDLDHLQEHVLARASFVEAAVENAVESLKKADVDLAKEVLAGDSQLCRPPTTSKKNA